MARITYPTTGTSAYAGQAMWLNVDVLPTDATISRVMMHGGRQNPDDTTPIYFVIYRGTTLVWKSPPVAGVTGGFKDLIADVEPALVLPAGTTVRWGASAESGEFRFTARTGHSVAVFDAFPAPATIGSGIADNARAFGGYLEYNVNAAPLQGTWMFPPTPATTSGPTPTFQGTLPHPASEPNDYSKDVQLRIVRVSDGVSVHDVIRETTTAERANKVFIDAPFASAPLTLGVQYRADFRHRDSADIWAQYSALTTFTIGDQADAPAPSSPTGKLNALSGYSYVARHTAHPTNLQANGYQVQVFNAQGTAPPLYDSGIVALGANVPVGSDVSAPEWHADLGWNTSYNWRMAVRTTDNVLGRFSALMPFRTNTPANAPVGLTPADDQKTDSRTFSCLVSDPDGDLITAAQMELVDATTGLPVGGATHAMTVTGGVATATLSAGLFVANRNYRWRARARDYTATGYGQWSPQVTFIYASAPAVNFTWPVLDRTNLIGDPGFENDDRAAYWTEMNRTGTSYVDSVADVDVLSGGYARRAVGNTGQTTEERSKKIAVDPTKPYLASCEFRLESGATPGTDMVVRCYNSGGTFLSEVRPVSIKNVVTGAPTASWTRYGGIVWHQGSGQTPVWPANTAQAEQVVRATSNSTAVVRYDEAHFEQLPVTTAGDWPDAQKWFGYFDGARTGYVSAESVGGYSWTGDANNSPSSGKSVLTGISPRIRFSYSSSTSSAKKDDRLLIDEWREDAWARVSEPAYRASTDTDIAIPAGIVKNEGRYRMKVQAHDTADNLGETAWLTFDVSLVGPPQLRILGSSANAATAVVGISFESSSLADIEFGGIEVARESVDGKEPRETLILSGDKSLTSFDYHFPVSGREYVLMVRQWQNVGSESVQGRWSRTTVTVDYYERFFLKDVEEPDGLSVPFKAISGQLPSWQKNAPVRLHMPWGRPAPVQTVGEGRWANGTSQLFFYEDSEYQDSLERRYELLEQMVENRRTVCLLTHVPERKFFVALDESQEFSLQERITKTASIPWTQVDHREDWFFREGKPPSAD